MREQRGYTLVEMIVGVGIIGVLAAASVPNITSYLRSQASATGSEELGANLRLARSRAVMEGNDYVVQFLDTKRYVILDDDGGGNGIPGSAGFVAGHRGNGVADGGEKTYGPFQLPGDMAFATASTANNPFTGTAIGQPVTFPLVNGKAQICFHSNGTAETGGYVALAPASDVARHSVARCRVLQVLRSTGEVASRSATTGS
jgi:prepilin-type N-terminal cleavage/methylation domain-containing protein